MRFLPPILHTYRLSMSSLTWNVLGNVANFLLVWFIYLRFFFVHFDRVLFKYSHILWVCFPSIVIIFPWFVSYIAHVSCLFSLLIMSLAYFLYKISFIYPNCILLLFVTEYPILFSFCKEFNTFHEMIVFSCDLVNSYPPFYFLSM